MTKEDASQITTVSRYSPKARRSVSANLAYRGVALDSVQNPWHQVLTILCSIFYSAQRDGMCLRVTAQTHRANAFHLALLQRLIDPLNRHGLLLRSELIDADDDRLLRIHRSLIRIAAFCISRCTYPCSIARSIPYLPSRSNPAIVFRYSFVRASISSVSDST